MTNTPHCKIVSLMLLLGALAGCVTVSERLISVPSLQASKYSVTRAGMIEVGDVAIAIRPVNAIVVGRGQGPEFFTKAESLGPGQLAYDPIYYDKRTVADTDYFILELMIGPGRNRVKLDFRDVVLTIGNRVFRPSGYFDLEPRYGVGPIKRHSDYSPYPFCKPSQAPNWSGANIAKQSSEKKIENTIQLREEREYCFAIKFNTPPPHPSSPFLVELNRVTVNGETIPLKIQFTPGTFLYRQKA